MRVFGVMVQAGFKRLTAYPGAVIAGIVANTVFGLVRAAIMTAAIGGAGAAIGGYNVAQAATYVWLTQALLTAVNIWSWSELALRVRTGDVAVDLLRPVMLQWTMYAQSLGASAFQLLFRGTPMILIGLVTTGMVFSRDAWSYPLAGLSIVLSMSVSFALHWLINLIAFWVMEIRGFQMTYMTVAQLLSGFILPISWFPEWLQTLCWLTPFPALMQTPINVLMGQSEPGLMLAQVAGQVLWLGGLWLAGALLFFRGQQRVVIQGG
ncbi:ABC transporter permease [Haematomicrobium sanguinis]|uniref:ABC transporter permease n=1 Tax=Haematomicrobium sanguinis TaxID=479106 RepID=UPI00047CC17F|nr:ABC-2 family transporter protein [Haematomicrobium sanguinis]